MRDNASVLRIGPLCGGTQSGIWNITEAWALMLSSMKVTNSLPDLKKEKLGWLPVDVAAEAVLEVSLSQIRQGENDQAIPVYHILNPSV